MGRVRSRPAQAAGGLPPAGAARHRGGADDDIDILQVFAEPALLLSVLLSNARALAHARPVLLLDEVAAHLDADRRAALYDEIVALPAQALLTGTGRELFTALDGRADFIHVRRDGGASFAAIE